MWIAYLLYLGKAVIYDILNLEKNISNIFGKNTCDSHNFANTKVGICEKMFIDEKYRWYVGTILWFENVENSTKSINQFSNEKRIPLEKNALVYMVEGVPC